MWHSLLSPHIYSIPLTSCFNTQARSVWQHQFPFFNGDAQVGIIIDQQMSIKIGKIDQRRQVGGRCNCQGTFDHATDHDEQVMRTSYVNHFQGLANAATLHKLDVDTVDMSANPGNIFYSDATLIRDNGDGYIVPYELKASQVMRGNGLLNKLDVIGSQGIDILRSEEHTSELQSRQYLVCRLLL